MASRLSTRPSMRGIPEPSTPPSFDESASTDLTTLSNPTPDSVATLLHSHYQSNHSTTPQTYFQIGSKLLLSLASYQPISEQADSEIAKEHAADYKDITGERKALRAHVYGLVTDVYFHVKRSGLDQSVIFCGDSGSGKSYNKLKFIEQLKRLRYQSKKETRIYDQLINSEKVNQSFSSVTTSINPLHSKFGRYVELQYDNRGRTLGVKLMDYLIHRSKLFVNVDSNHESNFLVFYQMLAGLSSEERAVFGLNEFPSSYTYMQGHPVSTPNHELKAQFVDLKTTLKTLGFTRKFQSQIFQVLSAILHLGNIKFIDLPSTDQDGSVQIRNYDVLTTAAEFLGVHPSSLEALLTYMTKTIKKETFTVFLDANQCMKRRDDLAKCLYSLLLSWMTEHINSRLCVDHQSNFIGLLDVPGYTPHVTKNGFEQLCLNFANERIYNYVLYQLFDASNDAYAEDNVFIPIVQYKSNQDVVQLLSKPTIGLVAIMHKQANRSKGPATDLGIMTAIQKTHATTPDFVINQSMNQFVISHFGERVAYDVLGFMDANIDTISPDYIITFRGEGETPATNPFVSGLFNNGLLATESHPNDSNAIVSAQQTGLPQRTPSMKRQRIKDGETRFDSSSKGKVLTVAGQLQTGLDELFDTFDNTEAWFVLGLRPGSQYMEWAALYALVERYQLCEMIERKRLEYTVCYLHSEFLTRYQPLLDQFELDRDREDREVVESARSMLNWTSADMAVGNQYVYLKDSGWRDLEDGLRASEQGQVSSKFGIGFSRNLEDNRSYISDDDQNGSEIGSQMDDASHLGDLNLTPDVQRVADMEPEDDGPDKPVTKIRKAWICFTWGMTWWIPSFLLRWVGKMKLKEVRMAWREKVALCIIILLMSAMVVLFIVGINPVLCPERDIYDKNEIESYAENKERPYYSLYGRVYNMNSINKIKGGHFGMSYEKMIEKYSGQNLDSLFPIQINPNLCVRYDGEEINPQVAYANSTVDPLIINHDHRWYRGERNYKPEWFENVVVNRMKKVGDMAFTQATITKMGEQNAPIMVYLDKSGKKPVRRVYNFAPYMNPTILNRPDEPKANLDQTKFLGPVMDQLITNGGGQDITEKMDKILFKDEPEQKERIIQCMNNLFYAGLIDDRNSFQCVFAQYLLLALSIFLFLVLFVKFLASLQLGSRPLPEDHDKFVLCNVPCYTEDDESLARTINSLAVTKYDDKRKLLFIICDGMVIGGGNELPTPRILLNLLGSDPNLDPESLSFLSLGEGSKQHNMGKVYTGLYQIKGHVVPYLVVVKVGKPSERAKPGNRGKRDSQLILMNFFNKVHYDHPMVPLELEMYHQIKNIIGVDPHVYEFVLMVDADTVVMPDSLNRLVSGMLHDIKIIGLCGETSIMNEKDSWATMIQVYEYFMSHHLAKAFESLFGSVTCLPGCFSMYRLRANNQEQAILVNDKIISQYSENVVDTLHKKNLFHLGEDRYLTTLLLKNFPFNKMCFTPDAKCLTNAPDTWEVLLSQRRRWINSTVHNLLELVFLQQLCGFCCFSMRFVIFLDLLSTVIMPATLGYLGYLVYRLITDRNNTIPVVSLVFIIAPYALQMIVFLIRRQWQQIGWMLIYLCALPVFAFFIPLYSFWHFDDFSWGNTRVVMGEKGKKKKVVAIDEGPFDPDTIPTRRWADYEEDGVEALTEKTELSNGGSSPSSSSLHKPPVQNYNPVSSFALPPESIPMYPMPNTFQGMDYRSQSPASHMVRPGSKPNSRPNSQFNIPQLQGFPSPTRSHFTIPTHHVPTLPDFQPPSDFPNPSDLVQAIHGILSATDLMTLSKKQVRIQLTNQFNYDFENYKQQINQWIELILKGEL